MLAHNVPKPDGKLPEPELFGCSSHLYRRDGRGQRRKPEDVHRPLPGRRHQDRPLVDGRRLVSLRRRRLAQDRHLGGGPEAISRAACGRSATTRTAKGVKTIVWFEPERVHADTWLTKNHPEWVLGGAGGGLLNLGNPQARQWLTDHVDKLLTDEGIDLYRQDFNMDPLGHWRGADPPDRQGITEIRHVEGYLAYWDELLKRHPGHVHRHLRFGRAAKRSGDAPPGDPAVADRLPLRAHRERSAARYGISLWIPLSGTGAADVDTYIFRSNMVPFTNCLFDVRLHDARLRPPAPPDRPVAPDRRRLLRRLLPAHRVQHDQGFLDGLAVRSPGDGRRASCRHSAARSAFSRSAGCGCTAWTPTPNTRSAIWIPSSPSSISGRELTAKGLLVSIPDQPGAVVIRYKKVE